LSQCTERRKEKGQDQRYSFHHGLASGVIHRTDRNVTKFLRHHASQNTSKCFIGFFLPVRGRSTLRLGPPRQ
jgi:hypothetical protein